MNSLSIFRAKVSVRPVPTTRCVGLGLAALAGWITAFALLPAAAAENYEDLCFDAEYNLRVGKYPEALKLYKKANEIKKGTSAECLWGMAQSYNKLGAHKNAIDAADRLIETAGDAPEYLAKAWVMRGSSYSSLAQANANRKDVKMLGEAERSFRKVLELSPDSNTTHYNLGLVLLWLERTDEGVEELRSFVQREGEGPLAEKARMILENPRRAGENFIPSFSMVTSEGEFISSDDLKGKVILLDFWGTWCPPCRDAVPYLTGLSKRYANREFVLISIAVNDEEEEWRKYISKNKMNWAQVRDANHGITRMFQVNAFPTYILVDHEGVIVGRKIGGGFLSESAVASAVNKALKTSSKEGKAREKNAATATP